MALTKEKLALLQEQGLAADIRNNLSTLKSLSKMIKDWQKITDQDKKDKLLELILKDAKQAEKNIDHICDSLIAYEDPKNEIPF